MAAKGSVSDEVYKNLVNEINTIKDNILSAISTANGYAISGTNNTAEMQTLVDELNELGITTTIEEAFSYDTLDKTFKLNASILKSYVDA